MGFEAGDGLRLFSLTPQNASVSGGTFTGGPGGPGMDALPGYGLRAIGRVDVAILGGHFIAAHSALGDGSTFNLSGGQFDGPIELINQAVLNASNGQFYSLLMRDGSSAALNGGVFRFFDMHDTSVLDIYDGSIVSNSIIGGNAEINLRGGSFKSELGIENVGFDLQQNSVMNVYGMGLSFQNQLLQGTLADGTPIQLDVVLADNAVVNLIEIPEPSTTALATLGLIGLVALRWVSGRRLSPPTTDSGAH